METYIAGYEDELIDLLQGKINNKDKDEWRRVLILCKLKGHMRYMRHLIIDAELTGKYKLGELHGWMLKANMSYPKNTGIETATKNLEENCNGYMKLLAQQWWHKVLKASYLHIIVVDNVDTEYSGIELNIVNKLDKIIGVTKIDM